MAADAKAMDVTGTDLFNQIVKDPNSFALKFGQGVSGKNGEGQRIQGINDTLMQLKQQVQSGKLSLTQYSQVAEPLINQAQAAVGRAGNAVGGQWNQLIQNGLVSQQQDAQGKHQYQLPFTQQEYARLPDTVLPTQGDVQKGLFNPNLAPTNRIQQPTAPAANPGVAPGTPGVTNPSTNQSTKDILDIVGNGQPGVDARTDRGQLLNQGDNNAQQLAETLALQKQLKNSAVTDAGTSYQGQDQERQKSLSDLADLLSKNQMDQFNRAVPDLAEQANTQGILRSTGFGDSLARKYAQLGQDTTTQLGLQGIADRNTLLGQEAGLTGNTQQNAYDYANGLTDVVNTKIGAANSGLQRQFSLSDYQQQLSDAQKYGQAPAVSNSGSKASGAVSGGLGGASVGAKFGVPGAVLGAVGGAVAGGQAGKKA